MKEQSKPALDLLEESVHVFRNASTSALLAYYVGSFPFVLFFLYYWADMSASASAQDHLLEFSLALGLLYLWMKTWHSVFALLVRNELEGISGRSVTLGRWLRIAILQSVIQPSSLFIILVSGVLLLPLGWMYAFYRNVTVLGDGEITNVNAILRKAWNFARTWPLQNHKTLMILTIFSVAVFANVCILILFIPDLIHIFFGIETAFTRSGVYILNTTFLMSAIGISYLCLNPLSIVIFVLRCFYADAQHSGADLKIELGLVRGLYE